MRSCLVGIVLCLFSTIVSAQNELAFEEGVIYMQSGDSLKGLVELAVTYGKNVSFKQQQDVKARSIPATAIKAIKTPYNYYENLDLDGRPRLMSRLADGELRLFTHVTINKGATQQVEGGTYQYNNAPTILYGLQDDSTVAEVTKKNFGSVVARFVRSENAFVQKIESGAYTFANLEPMVKEYNEVKRIKKATRKITARLIDVETKKGVSNAYVATLRSPNPTRTNALGYFQLSILSWDTLEISHDDYGSMLISVPSADVFQIPVTKLVKVESKGVPHNVVYDDAPEFDGGPEALMGFIRAHIKYPLKARRAGDQGAVYVSFVVEKDGSLTNVKVVGSVSTELDAEALRIVSLMPKWIPAKKNGSPIATEYKLPVKFKLN